MKLKKIFLLALLLGGIVSCSWYEIPSSTGPSSSNISYHSFTNSFLDIEKPYLTMEKTSSSTIEDLDVDSFVTKCANQDSFVFILRSATCGHCKRLMEDRINPFIEETQSKIYSIEALEAFNITKEGLQDKVAFSKYASCFDGYYDELFYYNDEKEITGLKGVPVTMIFEKGKMVDYIYGYSSYYPIIEMITSYFIV